MVDQTAGAHEETRRDFLYVATGAVAAIGTAFAAWPLIDQMNPAADVLALSTTEVDISQIPLGQQITVNWQGKPVFIRHRTEEDIEAARSVDLSELRDPQPDAERVKEGKAEWLIMVGICTHLGCIPIADDVVGDGHFGGWFCPCHGSAYDTSGRIRRGPAPENLAVPGYAFTDDATVVIG